MQGRVVMVCIAVQDGVSGTTRLDSDGIGFAGEGAVEVSSEANDSLETLVRSSCVIRLLTEQHVPGLWVQNALGAPVVVSRDGEVVWMGFVEPRTYSQPYNSTLDELELNCVDLLSALQWVHYGGLETEEAWKEHEGESGEVTFADLVFGSLETVWNALLLNPDAPQMEVVMGLHRRLEDGTAPELLGSLSVDECVVLGEDWGDVWTLERCVTEPLRWLGLQAVQDGGRLLLVDWRGVLVDGGCAAMEAGGDTLTLMSDTVTLSDDNAGDTDTQLTVGESWNRVRLTSALDELDVVIEGPTDGCESVWPMSQRLCREYLGAKEYKDIGNLTAAGEGATYAVLEMAIGATTKDCAYKTDWWLRVKEHRLWSFPAVAVRDIADAADGLTRQHEVPWAIGGADGVRGAVLLSLAKEALSPAQEAEIKTHRLSWTDMVVVSVNGNMEDSRNNHYYEKPDETQLNGMAPVAVFAGERSVSLDPVDASTVNYVVLSGALQMLLALHSTSWSDCWAYANRRPGSTYPVSWGTHKGEQEMVTVVRRYYHAAWPLVRIGSTNQYEEDHSRGLQSEDWHTGNASTTPLRGFAPPPGKDIKAFKYERNADGSTTDKKWKVPVLACMLVVGDKVAVETGGGDTGLIGDFEWRTFKERDECVDDDEYYSQCIYLGFNPKIGDYLVGESREVMDNVTPELGIDVSGTAIPVRHGDGVHGRVRFEILGPVNLIYEDVKYKHGTWFRPANATTNYERVLPWVSSILLKDFKVRVVSDAGRDLDEGDGELVWLSDEADGYVNELELEEMALSSALTSAEARELGIAKVLKKGTVLHDGCGVTQLVDLVSGETDKAEKMIVDRVWRDVHAAHVELEQTVLDDGESCSVLNRFEHPALAGKTLRVTGKGMDLQQGTCRLTLREM